MMVDVGQENTFFDHSSLVERVFKLPGPIYSDPTEP